MKKLLEEFAKESLLSEALISPIPKVDGSYPQNQSMPGAKMTPSPVPPSNVQPSPANTPSPGPRPVGASSEPTPDQQSGAKEGDKPGEQKPEEEEPKKEDQEKGEFSFPDSLANVQLQVEQMSKSLKDFLAKIDNAELKTEFNSLLQQFGFVEKEKEKEPKAEQPKEEQPKEEPKEEPKAEEPKVG